MELNLGLLVTIIGMGIVFSTLFVLAEVIKIPQRFIKLFDKKRKKEEPAPQQDIPAPKQTSRPSIWLPLLPP